MLPVWHTQCLWFFLGKCTIYLASLILWGLHCILCIIHITSPTVLSDAPCRLYDCATCLQPENLSKILVQAQTTCLLLHPECLQNQHHTHVLLSVQDIATLDHGCSSLCASPWLQCWPRDLLYANALSGKCSIEFTVLHPGVQWLGAWRHFLYCPCSKAKVSP